MTQFEKQIKITTRDGELIEEIENNPYNLTFDFGKNEDFSDTQFFNCLDEKKLLELKENEKDKRIFYQGYMIGGPKSHLKGENLTVFGEKIETEEFDNIGKIIFYEEKEITKCSFCEEQHGATHKGKDEKNNPF
ncbi:28111_t:CDS:2 [Gigaspora margarita]|uniref:28111_t:CDS:1 n=1 Tax=Gigaspora margarita TaxID=4874 RepID=A0ABN7VX31_GIGMA|nr:28111_t:CDS:2 [Gigaspora margarita]